MPIAVVVVLTIIVYCVGHSAGNRAGRKEMLRLNARLAPADRVDTQRRFEIIIDAQVTDACKTYCEKMIADAHAAAEWRLPT